MKWVKKKISDIGQVIGGATPSTKKKDFWDGDVPWITPKDLSGYCFRYIEKGERNITKDGYDSCSTQMMPKNTILFSSRAPIGYVAIAKNELCTNQGFKSVIPNNDTDYLFLYYLLKYQAKNIEKTVGGGGSTFSEVSTSAMKNVEVMVPSFLDQKKIGSLLNAFDEKMENNIRMNANIENQIQAIFNERIAVFDSIPEGWKTTSLDKIATYLNGLAMQKYPPEKGNDSFPVLKIAELKQGYCDNASDRCSKNIKEDFIVRNGDVIFSWSASLFVDVWAGGDCGLNQHLFKVSSNDYDKWFYYCWTKYYLKDFIREASSKATTMGHITRDRLTKAVVIIPDKETYAQVGSLISSLVEKIIANKIENKKLSDIRDSLLSKIMSGKLDLTSVKIEE